MTIKTNKVFIFAVCAMFVLPSIVFGAENKQKISETKKKAAPKQKSVKTPKASSAANKKSNSKIQSPVTSKTGSGRALSEEKKIATPVQEINGGRALAKIRRQHKLGEISDIAMWKELAELHDDVRRFSKKDRISLLQTQSAMLDSAGFPILAAVYSTQAIKSAENPLDKSLEASWANLGSTARKRPVQNLMEVLGQEIELTGRPAPVIGTDWHYYSGNAAQKAGRVEKAMEEYGKVRITDRYFFPAKYQQAMIHVEAERLSEAEIALKAILYPTTQRLSPLQETQRVEMANYARMALARIYYEKKDFKSAVLMYRNVTRDSGEFYDALFEQSWAFFMAGYPNHALGAIHGVESPFFANVFNPEATMLKSIVYYWMCRYTDSRQALATFMEHNSDSVESLARFLDRKRLSEESAYQLFENVIAGVSSESLGMPRNVLLTAAEKDSMLLVRDQYASVLEERYRLAKSGVFGSKAGTKRSLEYLDKWSGALKADIGRRYLGELRSLKTDYERLYAQAEFLYVELLMSEKDQILGKDLHASTKMTNVSMKQDVSGWGRKTQSWAPQSDKGEYWWDEVGFYIYRVQPECTGN